jgi:hypothetical protein
LTSDLEMNGDYTTEDPRIRTHDDQRRSIVFGHIIGQTLEGTGQSIDQIIEATVQLATQDGKPLGTAGIFAKPKPPDTSHDPKGRHAMRTGRSKLSVPYQGACSLRSLAHAPALRPVAAPPASRPSALRPACRRWYVIACSSSVKNAINKTSAGR